MKKIVLISCVKKKMDRRTKAEEMYISTLFKNNLKYAKSLNPSNIFILSAEHGLLELNTEIDPYDKTLNKMCINDIKKWSELVSKKLQIFADLNFDEFIILAGIRYRKFLIPSLKNVKIPMVGLEFGKQLKWLKEKNDNK